MHDARHLGRLQGAAGVEVHHDRGGGFLFFPDEYGRLGDGEVHPGGLDGGHGLDGAAQFPFQGALEIDLFGELADAELLVFHQLEADGTAFGQPLGGQAQTDFMDFFTGHQDGAAALGELVGNVELFEGGDDGAAILFRQVAEQHLVVGLAAPQDGAHDEGGDGGDRHHEGDLLLVGQPAQGFAKFFADLVAWLGGRGIYSVLGCRHR